MDTNSVDDNHPLSTNNGIGDEAEGIWSADIEQSFLEALAIYPPCGRRKIILTEEGKMYGRNELVARYIKIRTGKTRTRKQVSSHLQVLAKRRSKEIQSLRNDKAAQQVILDRLRRYTSAEIVSLNNEQIASDNDSCSDDNGESKKPKITSPVKNLLQPVPIDEHVVKSVPILPVKLDLIKSSQDSHLPSQTAVFKKHTVKKEVPVNKADTPMAPMMNTSRPMFLPNSPIAHTHGTGRSRCSSNASSSSPLSSGSTGSQTVTMVNPLIYPLATIGGEHFRLHDLSAVIEIKRTIGTTPHQSLIYPPAEIYTTEQRDLVHLHANDIRMKNIHAFETISIDQIFDKFPRNDGLKDLFERNPDGSFYLIKFWADVPIPPPVTSALNIRDESFFTSFAYSSSTNRPIHISTRLCSFGKQVLEKVDMSENPQLDPFQQFVHRFDRTPLCEYMVQFIQKLRSLPNAYMMNSVLENFTVLQVIKCLDNSERLLLCLAFVFEIAMPDVGGPQYQVYKLVSNLK